MPAGTIFVCTSSKRHENAMHCCCKGKQAAFPMDLYNVVVLVRCKNYPTGGKIIRNL